MFSTVYIIQSVSHVFGKVSVTARPAFSSFLLQVSNSPGVKLTFLVVSQKIVGSFPKSGGCKPHVTARGVLGKVLAVFWKNVLSIQKLLAK